MPSKKLKTIKVYQRALLQLVARQNKRKKLAKAPMLYPAVLHVELRSPMTSGHCSATIAHLRTHGSVSIARS